MHVSGMSDSFIFPAPTLFDDVDSISDASTMPKRRYSISNITKRVTREIATSYHA